MNPNRISSSDRRRLPAITIIASIIDHLRHSYSPLNRVLVKSPEGHWQPAPVAPGARTEEGLVVYRFGTSLYYASASKLVEDVATDTASARPWVKTPTSTRPARPSRPSTPPCIS